MRSPPLIWKAAEEKDVNVAKMHKLSLDWLKAAKERERKECVISKVAVIIAAHAVRHFTAHERGGAAFKKVHKKKARKWGR